MTVDSKVMSAARPVQPSALLRAKLARLRHKDVGVAVLSAVALAVGVGLELLALAMFLDWWLDLPWGARLGLLAVQAAVLGYIALRHLLPPLLRPPDDDELALKVEKARPEFRSRLIAAIQLTRPGALPPGASAALVEAMVEQTEALAAPMDFNRLVPTDRLKILGAVAGLVGLMAVAALVWGGPDVRALLRRAFLGNVPVPRKTRVLVPEGHRIVGRGDRVRLEAYAQGLVPARGKLLVKSRGRRAQEFILEPDRDHPARFGRTLENVQESFDYVIHLHDGRSDTFTVTVLARPTVVTVECEQHYPAYTGLKPARRSLGDLTLLAGSVLKLKITATKDIEAGFLKLVSAATPLPSPAPAAQEARLPAAPDSRPSPGQDSHGLGPLEEVPLQVNAQNRRELLGQLRIPARGLGGFSVQLRDTQGMESRDQAVYRLEILPDKAPLVRITYPERKEELYTRQATALVGLEATDDFGLARVRLRYKVDTLEGGAEKAVDLDLGSEPATRLRRRYEWRLGDFNPLLKEGTVIEYWIEAQDNNDATGPGVGASDHQFAKIVSEADKRADLLNRAGDYLGSVSDVAADQERASRNLGAIIREKAAGR